MFIVVGGFMCIGRGSCFSRVRCTQGARHNIGDLCLARFGDIVPGTNRADCAWNNRKCRAWFKRADLSLAQTRGIEPGSNFA